MLINGGQLQDEISRLSTQEGSTPLGSPANLTGTGTKVIVEDIEPDIRGELRTLSSITSAKNTITARRLSWVYFKSRRLLRYGACYDVVQDALSRFYEINPLTILVDKSYFRATYR